LDEHDVLEHVCVAACVEGVAVAEHGRSGDPDGGPGWMECHEALAAAARFGLALQ